VTSSSLLPVSTIRDLTLLGLDDDRVLVVACDSVGSIGPKPHDQYPASAALTAHYALRVPLLELVAAGARPELVVDTLSVELDPTGSEMIAEVRRVAASVGLGAERVTGSTEDNVPSLATGVGVTVLGTARRAELRPGTSRSGDVVLCLGRPTSAPDDVVVMDDARMLALDTLVAVLAVDGVHDALPVGSKGVRHELGELAATAGLVAEPVDSDVDVSHSGGPASCVLVSVAPHAHDDVVAVLPAGLPFAVVGRLA